MNYDEFGACVRKWSAALLVTSLLLFSQQSAMASEKPTPTGEAKAALEVKKLRLEVAQLKRDRRWWFPGPVGLVAGLLTGVGTTAATVWVAHRARRGERDQSVHEKRLEFYPRLVKATSRLAIYFPGDYSLGKVSIDPDDCIGIGRAMSQWYFDGGGLLLSEDARDAYFKLARALTRASSEETLNVPTFPDDAAYISKEEVDRYQAELNGLGLDDVENWVFGNLSPEKEAMGCDPSAKFKDYVFIQRLSSKLRSTLTEDLNSRRLPV